MMAGLRIYSSVPECQYRCGGWYIYQNNQRFVKIARRGSLNETRHWLRLACRNLLTQKQSDRLHPLLNELSPKLNPYLNSLKQKPKS
jgi:four helix bundle protein